MSDEQKWEHRMSEAVRERGHDFSTQIFVTLCDPKSAYPFKVMAIGNGQTLTFDAAIPLKKGRTWRPIIQELADWIIYNLKGATQ